jgi:hypothetical protein
MDIRCTIDRLATNQASNDSYKLSKDQTLTTEIPLSTTLMERASTQPQIRL